MKKFLLLRTHAWILVAVLIISACNNQPKSTTGACTNDFLGLSTEDFLKGIARYRQYQWTASNARIRSEFQADPGFEDARACWYSLAQLKEFICQIEHEIPDTAGEVGIRFYYATYPDTQRHVSLFHAGNWTWGEEVSVGMRHTLFMVPTFHDKELNVNVDYIRPLPTHSEERPAMVFRKNYLTEAEWRTYLKRKTRLMVLGGFYRTDASGENQGSLCPPTPPGCVTDPGSTFYQADNQ